MPLWLQEISGKTLCRMSNNLQHFCSTVCNLHCFQGPKFLEIILCYMERYVNTSLYDKDRIYKIRKNTSS